MKQCLIFTMAVLIFSSCGIQNKIKSIEYVDKPLNLIVSGLESPETDKLLLVCYNKYFNQERYSSDFIIKNKLNTIDYKTNMTIQIFLGETLDEISELKVEKIQENKDNLKVFYSYSKQENNNQKQSPFVIVQMSKSKKPVIFFENGVEVKMPKKNLYFNF